MDASNQYVENAISTQQRGKLLVMLYEGAVKFLRVAREKLQEGDFALKGVYIGKAQDIVAELNNSLNMEVAPQMAGDLRALYNFLYRTLNEANVERSEEKIETCINILDQLRETWEQVVEKAGPAVPDVEEGEFTA
ncbi:MAG: flagellar export chaperone FliS [Candidatus Brocadiaceae bacterium]|jgi:flagellar protein FliS